VTQTAIWTAFETSDQVPDCSSGVAWLTPAEKERLALFRVSKRREEWLLGRFTAKRVVESAAPETLGRTLSPEAFEIASERSGAPFARLTSGERLPIRITVSHSHGAAFCALVPATDGAAIGGDLEWVEPRSPGFVRDFLTQGEAAIVEAADPANRPLLANAIWSAKESVLKALEVGLAADTRAVEIRLTREPAQTPFRPPETAWHRFDAACAAGMDASGAPLSGFWATRGLFVVTLAARLPAPTGKGQDGHDRDGSPDGNDLPDGDLRPRAS
jgi:4'-phosphopantetheinyl transferase